MKKLILLAVCAIFVCANGFAQNADTAKTAAPQGASGAGQPQVAMKTIFEYKKELSLTDKQEKDLRDTLEKFQKYMVDRRNDLNAMQVQLNDMITKKENTGAIRKQLEKMSAVQVNASIFDIETSRKVESILTPIQIERWKNIQAEFQKKMQEQMQAARAAQAAGQK
jgi:Spy/CpxP family protein refolding chaperone